MKKAVHTLAISIGNTSLFAGVFAGGRLVRAFRLAPRELARLPVRVGRRIDVAAVCSVVPALTPDVLRLVRHQWGLEATVLEAAAPHGLKIGYRRPRELGTDRLAAALGARAKFPGRHLIVVDCGTATTVTALHRDGTLLGGAIFPGLSLSAEALSARTAQLPRVAPRRPPTALGRAPREAIASGVFFGQLGAIRELVTRIRTEAFGRASALVIGTGGHAPLLADEGVFDRIESYLVLEGLREFAARAPAA